MTAIIEAAETTNAQLSGLSEIFATSLAEAKIHIRAASNETLQRTAVKFYVAFKRAQWDVNVRGKTPIIPGNDPHNQEAADHSKLGNAVAGVYGYRVSDAYNTRSPNAIKAMEAMQPIAHAMHTRGLCIFT